MAATKSRTSLASGVTMTAGAANVTTSGPSLSTAYGATLDVSIANGGTGPTVAGQVQIQVSNDTGTLWVNFGGPLVAGVTASTTYSWCVEIPIGCEGIQIVSGGNTGQNCTLNADISVVTGI